ncbi:MAG: SDR family NAD(P)-dependent oxidoreductase, partial [Candidatus Eremiobacteraeota bacterium]|nr:SDR family NAD(P)-dependent oxidoreductase [Candidatus Eremiobacteraeota bacterium]
MKLAGSLAVVSGASSGIGEATARALAGKGARVALLARSREALDRIARE